MLSRRLRLRLAFKQTVSFALLVTILAWGAYAFLARHISGKLDEELEDRAIAMRSMLQIREGQVRWLNKAADTEVRQHFEQSARFYQLLDDTGHAVETSRELSALQLPFSQEARHTLSTGSAAFEDVSIQGGGTLRIYDAPVSGPEHRQYLLRVGMSSAASEEEIWRVRVGVLVLLALLCLLHGLNCWVVGGLMLQPLEKIAAAAREITPFDQSKRLPVFGRNDELDELSSSINATVAKLQASFQRMSEFLRNLSHEIRQPLTVMRAEAEQALRLTENDSSFKDMVRSQLQHVELLARTVSDLMELAQSDSDEIQLSCHREDLSELVQAAIDGMRLKSNDSNIHISGTVQQGVIGDFDAGQLWRLVLNLLDNAIKFSPANGRVDISLTAHAEVAILSVSDTGSGIPVQEQAKIFERGYRTYAARKSPVTGTGLGLHFARAIALAHGGTIEVISVPGHGSCFRVALPIKNSPSVPGPEEHEIHEGSIN
jgi:signal transduction histidine kinase